MQMRLPCLLLLAGIAAPALAQRPTDYPPHMRRLVNWGLMLGLAPTCGLRPDPWVATLRGRIDAAAREMARSPEELQQATRAIAQQEENGRATAQQQGRAYCDATAGPLLPLADEIVAGRTDLAAAAQRAR